MAGAVTIYGPSGQPLPAADLARARKGALQGGGWQRPYAGADPGGQDLAGWHPGTWSPDTALAGDRQRLSDRLHDLVRNDGWAAGTVTAFVDAAIGPAFRLNSAPDYEALGISFEAAIELGHEIERVWRGHANDPRRYADAARARSLQSLMALLFRHVVIDGEALVLPLFRPVPGYPLATAFQAVHPARLSNPNEQPDDYQLRGGVEIDDFGAAVAYHIRASHPGDIQLPGAEPFVWERVPREWSWGRPRAIHHFLAGELEQHRGVSPLAPIVRRLRMNQKYEQAELQAALANAVLAAYLETALPPEAAAEMLDGGEERWAQLNGQRLDFYEAAPIQLNGFRVPVLPVGDKVNFPTAARPNREAGEFVKASLRNIAAATGLNPSTISRDYSQTNYSSERAAMLEAWRRITAERSFFAQGMASPMLLCVLEEAFESGLIVPPKGAPDFWDAPAAYLAGEWIGPARGWVDPVKEAVAAKERMDAGLSTLRQEAAEQGHDYQDLLRQQARERHEREELGLPEPGGVEFAERDEEGQDVRIRRNGRAAAQPGRRLPVLRAERLGGRDS